MADEIKTVVGNQLVKETITEIVEEEKHKKKTVFFQAKFVEGLLAETLSQLKHQMDALFLIFFDEETKDLKSFKGPKKRMEAIKGSYLLFNSELKVLCECLEPYHKASLKPKHRAVREIANEGRDRLIDLAKGLSAAKNINNHYVTQFAKEICLLLTNLHVVHHDKTPKKERNRVVKEYRDGG